MVAVPVVTPVTTPVAEPIVTSLPDVLQLPPGVPSATVIIEPSHTAVGPVITAGSGFTGMVAVVAQPVPIEYVIIEVPVVTPNTTPLLDPMVAIPVEPLIHVPPVVGSVSVPIRPIHIDVLPMIGPGEVLIEIAFVM